MVDKTTKGYTKNLNQTIQSIMTHKFEIKEEIEVTFPHYRRYAHFYYKVLDEKKEISVMFYDGVLESAQIKYDDICKPNTFHYGSYEITEEEFNETLARAYALIINKNN